MARDHTEALRDMIAGDAGVSAIVGAKVYRMLVPQGTALPYIRIQGISDVRVDHMQGYETKHESRVQVDCFAGSLGQARAIGYAVIAATDRPATVAGVTFTRIRVEGPRDLGEDVAGKFVYRSALDLVAWHDGD